MAKVEISGVGQIHITVEEIERAVAFYRDVLEMKLLFQVPEQSMAFFDCGGVRLYLGPVEGAEQRFSPLIYYRVADISEACAEIERRGVALESAPHVVHRTEEMELWLAFLNDPDGHMVALMEERSVSPS